MGIKEEFIKLYRELIKREGADKMLNYLQSTDFFTAPASSKYHNAFEGGLADHSLNVYYRLKKLVDSEDSLYNKYSDETIAIIGLLHDVCKINENGVWVSRTVYNINEDYPFGHGEKSVYLINKFMELSDVEALAINWHMGPYDKRCANANVMNLEAAFKYDPIVFLTHLADSMATYIDEADTDENLF